jgi:RNA polymerase primary sigma factor
MGRIMTELSSGVLSPADVVELADRTPDSAEQAFRAWAAAAQRIAREAARREREAEGGEPPSTFEQRLASSQALAHEAQLHPDMIARLIDSARHTLPDVLEERAAQLSAEVERIRCRFVEANQGLVHYVGQRYMGMGMAQADIIQEGNLGLLRAIDKFDHRRGGRFGTYAIWWVRQGIRRAMANQSRTIRIPVHALGARHTLSRAEHQLVLQLGRAPTDAELTAATGVGQRGIANVASLVKEPLSLDAPRGPDSELRLGDAITDPTEEDAADRASGRERAEHLRNLLHTLNPRERAMLRMRFGLDGHEECTLDQIGRSFAVTRERVRQIVDGALQKLQRQTRRQQLDLASF